MFLLCYWIPDALVEKGRGTHTQGSKHTLMREGGVLSKVFYEEPDLREISQEDL